MAKFNLKRDPLAGLVPAGIHRFVVEKSEARNGPNGPYVNLHLRTIVNGQKWKTVVYEVLSTSDESKFRVDQFFDAVGADEAGEVDENWFVNKSAWAKFDHKPNRDGVLQARVVQYLTEEQAENQLERMANGDSTAAPRQPAANPTRKSGGKKAAVAEMDGDEDAPF